MKQRPSFQFYQQDFLASQDVQTMTAEQVGCYCLMLFNCYNNGGTISSDPEDLKVLCRGIAPASKVLKKFYTMAEFLRHKRVDEELEKQINFSKTQSQNAKKGWSKRKNKPMPSHNHGINPASIRQCSSSSSSSSIDNTNVLSNIYADLFEYFQKQNQCKIIKTKSKQSQLIARLKTFTADQIRTAIDNRASDAFMQGQNDNHKEYRKDWCSLFRNDEQIEKWLNRTPVKPRPLPGSPEYYLTPRPA